jgi:hypothetical protein
MNPWEGRGVDLGWDIPTAVRKKEPNMQEEPTFPDELEIEETVRTIPAWETDPAPAATQAYRRPKPIEPRPSKYSPAQQVEADILDNASLAIRNALQATEEYLSWIGVKRDLTHEQRQILVLVQKQIAFIDDLKAMFERSISG